MMKFASMYPRSCIVLLVAVMAIGFGSPAMGGRPETVKAPSPDNTRKCPVCGMFVHRYPDFIASVTFEDGHVDFFDGVKDMFKYLFNLKKYSPNHRREHVRTLFVTEYYDMQSIDGHSAYYVFGSDVYGPMGHELIPLTSLDDARQFQKDHKGKRIVRYKEITPGLIRQLD